ncbi:lysozyme inhibitor LprI family protein [Herbaspirillum camelliae]|uniref:lysozyme inhibitor LprI family protein n=1 Tax=Herbaspirillum camelliae TaxID=1892903 RepID=UPI000949E852|nr:lysozyme inhibitor LprI family protein [Herbaspirillum camelliae]
MAGARDIIQEIAEVRERRRYGSAMAELPIRLHAIRNAFSQVDSEQRELQRYFPVALVACLEGYFRMAIKDLIDFGEPYLSNAEKPANALKFDFTVMRAIHGKSITFGELIAHGTPISRLEHIDSILSTLVGKSFLTSLRTVEDRWAQEVHGMLPEPILSDPDAVFKGVSRAFELRHIICHEIASAYEITSAEVADCLESCMFFLKAADEFISETMHPNAPLSQSEMNIAASEENAQKMEELEAAISEFRQKINEAERAEFDVTQNKWNEYRSTWANFAADLNAKGGTIWPIFFFEAQNSIIEHRKSEIAHWDRFNSN